MKTIIPQLKQKEGFTLVITLLLMSMVTIIAVALLTLSSVSLRTINSMSAQKIACMNAKLALMMALGDLQNEMGPDRRISATAGILDTNINTEEIDGIEQPHLTGVWRAIVSPIPKWKIGSPTYDKVRTFRKWLVSGNPDSINKLEFVKQSLAPGANTFELVSAGNNVALKRRVQVPLISGNNFAVGWWVADEGVKATLNPSKQIKINSVADALLSQNKYVSDSYAVLDAELPNSSNGLDERLLDLSQIDIPKPALTADKRAAYKYLHDLTTDNEIVPVDVTKETLRNCMNLRLDWLNSQPLATRKAEGTFGQLNGPFNDYRLFSWDQLANYTRLARKAGMVTLDAATGRPKIRCHKQFGYNDSNGESEWNPNIGEDRWRVQPVLLKLSYVLSYATEKVNNPNIPAKCYALRFFIYPILVLWNPYNVDLEVPEYIGAGVCPLTFHVNKGTPEAEKVDLNFNQSGTSIGFGPDMGGKTKLQNLVIPAGATKVIYPQPVRWETFPAEHRHPRFFWTYYIWGLDGNFNLGDSNYGGVLKNLKGDRSVAYFFSILDQEILGTAASPLKIEVTPSTGNYGDHLQATCSISGAHTDWWGSNGPGADNATTLQKFGVTTQVSFKMETDGSSPQVSTIPSGEIPVHTFLSVLNKPTPLLIFDCYRKPADENLFPAKHGSFSVSGNPIHGVTSKALGTSDTITPYFETPYTFRYKAITNWMDVTKTFQLPANRDDRIYFGNSYSPSGQLNIVDQEIPLAPIASLAQLQCLPLFDYRPVYDPLTATATTIWYGGDYGFHEGRATQFAQNHAIGNSYASPGINPEKLNAVGWKYVFNINPNGANHLRVDRSYIANTQLWDGWFCSSIASQDAILLGGKTTQAVATDFFNQNAELQNNNIVVAGDQSSKDPLTVLFDSTGNPTKEAYSRLSQYVRIKGALNVNSVSVKAWEHFLAGFLSTPPAKMESVTGSEKPDFITPEKNKFYISRYALANDETAESATNAQTTKNRYWNGSREITKDQLKELATAIVYQVKKRGPFLSLSEFVNRRLSTDKELAVSGAIQSALDDQKVSINEPFRGDLLTGSENINGKTPQYNFPEAEIGPRAQGITGYVTQADILQKVGNSLSARSDTFTIRAVGLSRDADGKVNARAYCEAVIQRTARYMNSIEENDIYATNPINVAFGRKFKVISFRWLAESEL